MHRDGWKHDCGRQVVQDLDRGRQAGQAGRSGRQARQAGRVAEEGGEHARRESSTLSRLLFFLALVPLLFFPRERVRHVCAFRHLGTGRCGEQDYCARGATGRRGRRGSYLERRLLHLERGPIDALLTTEVD